MDDDACQMLYKCKSIQFAKKAFGQVGLVVARITFALYEDGHKPYSQSRLAQIFLPSRQKSSTDTNPALSMLCFNVPVPAMLVNKKVIHRLCQCLTRVNMIKMISYQCQPPLRMNTQSEPRKNKNQLRFQLAR